LDIRDAEQVVKAVETTVETFGGLDIVINNASAISLTSTEDTSVKQYDLMNEINSRGTWVVSKAAIPCLKESAKKGRNPHILTLSPPLKDNIILECFSGQTAYSLAKFGMSLVTLGLSGELKEFGIAANALWPLTAVDTEAIRKIASEDARSSTRHLDIMAVSAVTMLSKKATEYTGQFEIDETLLRRELGYTTKDLRKFANVDDDAIMPDIFVPDWAYDEIKEAKAKERSSKL